MIIIKYANIWSLNLHEHVFDFAKLCMRHLKLNIFLQIYETKPRSNCIYVINVERKLDITLGLRKHWVMVFICARLSLIFKKDRSAYWIFFFTEANMFVATKFTK